MAKAILLSAALALGLAACATPKATTSGFLGDYSALQSSANKPYLRTAGADPAAAKALPAVFIAPPENLTQNLSPSQAQAVTGDLFDALKKEFGTYWTLADAPAAGVLVIRTAVTDVKKSNVALNVATTAILGPVDYGTLSLEGEALDGGTGQRIAAIAWAKSSGLAETLETFTPTGSARALTPDFAADFAGLLGRAEEQMARAAKEAAKREAEAERRER